MRARRVLPALAVVIALTAASCSSGSETGIRPDLPPVSEGGPMPAVTVWDVGAQDWTQLSDFAPSGRPLLVWFWAPHCSACAAEAPGMVAFAEEYDGEIDVVGLGTQDDAEMAAEFVDRHDVPFPMLWDEGFDSWAAFGVTAQPATVLISADGEALGGWLGELPESEIDSLLA